MKNVWRPARPTTWPSRSTPNNCSVRCASGCIADVRAVGKPDSAAMDKVNILLVDDQPAKLLSYEVILGELGENLIKANSPDEALGILLRNDVAVVLIDVVMPQIDGFQLAAMIREHPRFQKLAIIFVSGVQIADADHLRGYEIGAVDYMTV